MAGKKVKNLNGAVLIRTGKREGVIVRPVKKKKGSRHGHKKGKK